jgi:NTE family protein
VLKDLSVPSKFSLDWKFLQDLFHRGRDTGREWLDAHYRDLGRRSSADLRKDFL